MRFEAILFNFDGVIANSKILSGQALADVLCETGLPTTLEESLRNYSMKRWSDVLAVIEARLGRKVPAIVINQHYKHLSRQVIFEVRTVPGIESFLSLAAGAPIAITASSEPSWISQTLIRFGLDRHFGPHVYTTSTLKRDKPDPEIYSHATRALGAEPRLTIAIEDSAAGVAAAVAAGVTAVGLAAGSHIRPHDIAGMREAGARFIANDFEEAADWIGLVS